MAFPISGNLQIYKKQSKNLGQRERICEIQFIFSILSALKWNISSCGGIWEDGQLNVISLFMLNTKKNLWFSLVTSTQGISI